MENLCGEWMCWCLHLFSGRETRWVLPSATNPEKGTSVGVVRQPWHVAYHWGWQDCHWTMHEGAISDTDWSLYYQPTALRWNQSALQSLTGHANSGYLLANGSDVEERLHTAPELTWLKGQDSPTQQK